MSENYELLQTAKRALGLMVSYLQTYESGTLGNSDVFEVELTAEQITTLKQAFVAKRTECIAALESVSQ
jgi:hypothetical protein